MGNARTHEIEALMDEEIETIAARQAQSLPCACRPCRDGLPALGIVAAVLGVVKAMGALDQSPEILGGLIGAALVGTFAGIFLSYAVVAPIATKVKIVREKHIRLYIIVKQTLLAFMNGAHAAGRHRARPQDDLAMSGRPSTPSRTQLWAVQQCLPPRRPDRAWSGEADGEAHR